MDHPPIADLLESAHTFPCVYKIKAIGAVDDQFEARVIEAVRAELATDSALSYTARSTAGGRHVAVTIDVPAQTAEHVRTIYSRIREVAGLTLLL